MNWLKKNWGWITITIIGILPLIGILKMINIDITGTSETWITMDSFTFQGRHRGELPKEVTGAQMAVKETGEWAIRWLVIVLSLTPFTILTKIKSRLHVRQAVGITAFVYAFLHLLFFCIDKGFIETFKEFGNILGLIATLFMFVLAITSNKQSMKYLRRKWKKIHKLAYLTGILAILHLALLEHGDWIPYAVILIFGFIIRNTNINKSIDQLRIRTSQIPVFAKD